MWLRAQVQLTTALPLTSHLPGVYHERYVQQGVAERIELLLEHASRMTRDAAIGLSLVHIQLPHPPGVYSRALHRMNFDAANSYVDSLALTDQVLGRLRSDLEQAHLWNRTALLVSSDHGWRPWLWRTGRLWTAEDDRLPQADTVGVPFIVKLPGQTVPLKYSKPFNTVVTRTVISGILSGKIRAAADIAHAIDSAGPFPPPSAAGPNGH